MFKDSHFDKGVILLCVRCYLAFCLSLRNVDEVFARETYLWTTASVALDIHRWVTKHLDILLAQFNQLKRPVTGKWHLDETYIKIKG